MDIGYYIMILEKEFIYDNVCRQWVVVMILVKGVGQKIGRIDYVFVVNLRLSKGWVLKKMKVVVRIFLGVKEFLINLFNKGVKDFY